MAKKTRQAPLKASTPNLIQTLSRYWQKRLVRVLAALLILGGAIYLQYRLANIPLPVDVEKSTPSYTPQTAELIKQERLVIDGASINRAGPVPNSRMLFSGDGAEFVSVEARFDSAVVGKHFLTILRTDPNQKLPPESLQQISYSPKASEEDTEAQADDSKSAPCRTSVDIALAEDAPLPREIHIFQQRAGSDRSRILEMNAIGADLVVSLLTKNFTKAEGAMQGLNCAKTLEVGTWSESFSAPAPVDILVPAGTPFRLLFTGPKGGMSGSRSGPYYEPFQLVALPVNATGVRKIKFGEAGPAVFEAARIEGQQPLILKHLRLGSEDVQLDFAGQAMVQEGGKFAVTFSLLQFAKANPILAGILAMFDAALLEWIRRSLMGSPK
ncbi:MAG TPA: hypothetical protein VFR80_12570 [Pyrinomonadaceae bacterium]|nr:hypothetical protein [Pyrinomonadaceae bacterium]